MTVESCSPASPARRFVPGGDGSEEPSTDTLNSGNDISAGDLALVLAPGCQVLLAHQLRDGSEFRDYLMQLAPRAGAAVAVLLIVLVLFWATATDGACLALIFMAAAGAA